MMFLEWMSPIFLSNLCGCRLLLVPVVDLWLHVNHVSIRLFGEECSRVLAIVVCGRYCRPVMLPIASHGGPEVSKMPVIVECFG